MKVVSNITRRAMLANGAAIAVAPALGVTRVNASFTTMGAQLSPIARLWAQAEALKARMAPFSADLAENTARTGLPGWMHFRGEVNLLGNRRYETLVQILKARALSQDDLAIVAQATRDADMQLGPKSWAHAQFDQVAAQYHLAA